MYKAILCGLWLSLGSAAWAQIAVSNITGTTSTDAINLANVIKGTGIQSFSNVTLTARVKSDTTKGGTSFNQGTIRSSSAGTFSSAQGILGIDSGIILSTGGVYNAPGPNTADDITQDDSAAGDADLAQLINVTTSTLHDATILEFDFVPTYPTIAFRYVFASDEYFEYANSDYNDVFGFFVNGHAPSNNCALIPGTNTPVAINTVNGGNPLGTNPKNAQYYRNNSAGAYNTEMDGLTTVFSAQASVTPGVVNHIKIAIADVFDGWYDSNVFIKQSSFVSGNAPVAVNDSYSVTANNSLVVAVGSGVLANDTDLDSNLQGCQIIASPAHGTVTLNTDGSFTYTPATGYTGADTFTYQAVDTTFIQSNVGIVSLSVAFAPQAPGITQNPTDRVVAVGATATFTATASGYPTPTVQWQVSTDNGGSYNDIGGATSTSYVTPATVLGDSGKLYRAVFTNASGSASTSGAALTVLPAPTVTAINPSSGSSGGGTPVTITGTDFTGATVVKIGGVNATGITVVDSATITATTGAHAVGLVDVVVTTPGGTGTGVGLYNYVAAPTVTSISPNNGTAAGSTFVTITGTNFLAGATVTIGGVAATGITVVNSTTITATTAAGSPGPASVLVTTTLGTNGANTLYTYTGSPPTISRPTATSITATSAVLGGQVASDGGSPITARGVVYAITSDNGTPRIAGFGVTQLPTSGTTGLLAVSAMGLAPGTTYSYAAYATNGIDTSYTGTGSFTTPSDIATLSNIVLATATLNQAFDSNTLSYTADVPYLTSTLTLTPTATQANATITVDTVSVASGNASGPLSLMVGPNVLTVVVTAQDGATQKTYTVTVTRAQPPPEIALKGKGQEITDGDSSPSLADDTDFGPAPLSTAGPVTHTFTIENSGLGVLSLNGTPKVVISGANSADFSVATQPSATVAAGGGVTTFQITFDPAGAGARTATVSIDNDDTDENPYTFGIQGFGYRRALIGSGSATGITQARATLNATIDAQGTFTTAATFRYSTSPSLTDSIATPVYETQAAVYTSGSGAQAQTADISGLTSNTTYYYCSVAVNPYETRVGAIQSFTTLPDQWTWMGGSKNTNNVGSYFALGVDDPSNIPPSRQGAGSWTSGGRYWVFGGISPASTGNKNNDLWSYGPTTADPSVKGWRWHAGSITANQVGVYGAAGVFNSTNTPGARHTCITWTDAGGKLWLFGGFGISGRHNDLWCFDPSLGANGQWAFMKGNPSFDQIGVYGTKGVAAAANKPGGRQGGVAWADPDGTFWLWGGGGSALVSNPTPIVMNDLWNYNPATGWWTWVNGPNTTADPGNYGTKGVAAPTNLPSSRRDPIAWIDRSGALWLFGGQSTFSGTGFLNDLWKYEPDTGNWTWMKGSSSVNPTSVKGTQGVPDPANTPGGRSAGGAITMPDGSFYLFGGMSSSTNFFNEIWKLDWVTQNWTFVTGVNSYSIYGNLGIGDPANTPGNRFCPSVFPDASGEALWEFGGGGLSLSASGRLNDFWRFDFAPPVNTVPDSDHDGLDDIWETAHFGNLTQTAAGDFDSDGASNALEEAAGTDPNSGASKPTFSLSTAGGVALVTATPPRTGVAYYLDAGAGHTPVAKTKLPTGSNGLILDTTRTLVTEPQFRVQLQDTTTATYP